MKIGEIVDALDQGGDYINSYTGGFSRRDFDTDEAFEAHKHEHQERFWTLRGLMFAIQGLRNSEQEKLCDAVERHLKEYKEHLTEEELAGLGRGGFEEDPEEAGRW